MGAKADAFEWNVKDKKKKKLSKILKNSLNKNGKIKPIPRKTLGVLPRERELKLGNGLDFEIRICISRTREFIENRKFKEAFSQIDKLERLTILAKQVFDKQKKK